MKKFFGVLLAIILGFALIQKVIEAPGEAASWFNKGGDVAEDVGDGTFTFLGALSVGGFLFLAAVIAAVIIARRR